MQTQPEPDLYDAPPQEEPAAPEGEENDADNTQTELANIEAFPDAAPGKRYEVEIVMCHEKECEFRVVGEAGGDDKAPEGGEPEMAMAGGGEDDLMS